MKMRMPEEVRNLIKEDWKGKRVSENKPMNGNKFLIWTDRGWLKSPTYTMSLIGDYHHHEKFPTTMDICGAYEFTEQQAVECFNEGEWQGMAIWIVESKKDLALKARAERN